MMGFNFRFTTKPHIESGDDLKGGKQTSPHLPDQSSVVEVPGIDGRTFSTPKTPKLGKEEMSVAAAGGSLLFLFSSFPEALPLGVIGRSTILMVTAL